MKIAGTLSYVGASYNGFQRQNNGSIGVQNVIEEVLSSLANRPIETKAAGRTDAGVSAKGQVVCFDYPHEIDLGELLMQANRLLPPSIAFNRLLLVPEDFDPRHSAISKVYVYRYYVGEKDPFKKDSHARIWQQNFDFGKFNEVMQSFLGTHDFSSFTSKKEDKDNFIRRIEKIDCAFEEKSKEGSIYLKANGFMTYQIRYMVGMAMEVGLGKKSKEEVLSYLDRNPRCIVSVKAPSEGLTLEKVIYDEKLGL